MSEDSEETENPIIDRRVGLSLFRCDECGYEMKARGPTRLSLGATEIIEEGECPNCIALAVRDFVEQQEVGELDFVRELGGE